MSKLNEKRFSERIASAWRWSQRICRICRMVPDYASRDLMDHSRRNRILKRWGICIASLVIVLWFVVIFPETVYLRSDEVDIQTGRIRRSVRVLCVTVSRQVQASVLTNALPAGMLEKTTPEWHVVYEDVVFSSIRPQWKFDRAIAQINQIEAMWQTTRFTEDAKQNVALAVLRCWQTAGGSYSADGYVHTVELTAALAELDLGSSAVITTTMLPASPSAETRPAALIEPAH